MKTFDFVIEYVITGTIGVFVLLIWLAGDQGASKLVADVLDDAFLKVIAGVVALPVIYCIGIGLHHASWWLWRRLFHRPLFRRIFKDPKRKSHASMRTLAKSAYNRAGNPLGDDPGWEAIVEWCRFATYEYCSEAALKEYARQRQIYRATYGPLFALSLGLVMTIERAVVGSLPF